MNRSTYRRLIALRNARIGAIMYLPIPSPHLKHHYTRTPISQTVQYITWRMKSQTHPRRINFCRKYPRTCAKNCTHRIVIFSRTLKIKHHRISTCIYFITVCFIRRRLMKFPQSCDSTWISLRTTWAWVSYITWYVIYMVCDIWVLKYKYSTLFHENQIKQWLQLPYAYWYITVWSKS